MKMWMYSWIPIVLFLVYIANWRIEYINLLIIFADCLIKMKRKYFLGVERDIFDVQVNI